jgi:hypothetical protein
MASKPLEDKERLRQLRKKRDEDLRVAVKDALGVKEGTNGEVEKWSAIGSHNNLPVADIIAALKESTDAGIKSFIEQIAEIKAVFAYQGFDPVKMISMLLEMWKTTSAEFSVTVGKDFVISNETCFEHQMSILCCLFVMRGANWKHISDKSTLQLKELMAGFEATYNINTTKRAAGKALAPEVVTFGRIAACFPLKCLAATEAGMARELVPFSRLFPAIDYPRFVVSPHFHSTIPVEVCKLLRFTLTWMAYNNDKVLHMKTKTATGPTELVGYLVAGVKSKAVTDEARELNIQSLGMYEEGTSTLKLIFTRTEEVTMKQLLEVNKEFAEAVKNGFDF